MDTTLGPSSEELQRDVKIVWTASCAALQKCIFRLFSALQWPQEDVYVYSYTCNRTKLFLQTERKTSCSGDIGQYYHFHYISVLHYRQYTVIFICRTRKLHYQSSKTESRTSLDDWRRHTEKKLSATSKTFITDGYCQYLFTVKLTSMICSRQDG